VKSRLPLHGSNLLRTPITSLLVLLLAGAASLCAQERGIPAEKRAAIEKAVSSFMSANSVPGIAAAVVLDGEPLWSAGFGMADLEDYTPAASSTLFRLGSISKPITAVAILQLNERGKLDLDAPVQKYCPAFPKKDWPITTREASGTTILTARATSRTTARAISRARRNRCRFSPTTRWPPGPAQSSTIQPTATRCSAASWKAPRRKNTSTT